MCRGLNRDAGDYSLLVDSVELFPPVCCHYKRMSFASTFGMPLCDGTCIALNLPVQFYLLLHHSY